MKYIIIVIVLFVIQITPLSAQSIQYRYDNTGRLTQVIYPNQTSITYTYDNDGNRISAITASTPLPVELLIFNAQKQGSQVLLNWSTSQEINSDKFEVEFSKDGITFQSFISIPARGTSSIKTDYNTLHCCPVVGANYYRLKMIDRDGHFKYSEIRKVVFEFINEMKLFPNPISNRLDLKISFVKPFTKDAIITVYNSSGSQVYSSILAKGKTITQINMGAVAAGSYYIIVAVGGELYKEEFIKQ